MSIFERFLIVCVVGVQSQGQWAEEWIVVEDDTKFNFTYNSDKISGILTIPEFPVTEPDASVARLLETDLSYKIVCVADGCDWESFVSIDTTSGQIR